MPNGPGAPLQAPGPPALLWQSTDSSPRYQGAPPGTMKRRSFASPSASSRAGSGSSCLRSRPSASLS